MLTAWQVVKPLAQGQAARLDVAPRACDQHNDGQPGDGQPPGCRGSHILLVEVVRQLAREVRQLVRAALRPEAQLAAKVGEPALHLHSRGGHTSSANHASRKGRGQTARLPADLFSAAGTCNLTV